MITGPAAGADDRRYGTRWGRTVLVLLPALLVVGVMGTALVHGVWSAGYTTQAGTLGLSVAEVTGGPAAIVAVDQPVKAFDGSVSQQRVLRLGVAEAQVRGMCVTQQASLFGRTATLRIEIPSATVRGLVLDAQTLAGNVRLTGNVTVNINAADATVPGLPAPLGGSPDDLGILADGLFHSGSQDRVRGGQLSSAQLSGLSARLELGERECTG
ncbi:DUF6230 family protein [Skermania piniformis]|uniref:Cholesterol esterase n=1 Tax=Skermania pinensis TaxID=39122 RepID=A0ABX8SBK6_9ACTN|nr:DUF6230 family protein [Skermania piniformis]QXQ13096.1 hypothetical protein KV203_14520 [Skermania piniformis]